MAAFGYPRATGDMDLWIQNSPENATRVWRALKVFRAPLDRLKQSDFCSDDTIVQIGVAPHRIDIITHIDGLTFEEAWEDHQSMNYFGKSVPVISKTCLIRNKKATGRPQDQVDVQLLESDSKRINPR